MRKLHARQNAEQPPPAETSNTPAHRLIKGGVCFSVLEASSVAFVNSKGRCGACVESYADELGRDLYRLCLRCAHLRCSSLNKGTLLAKFY